MTIDLFLLLLVNSVLSMTIGAAILALYPKIVRRLRKRFFKPRPARVMLPSWMQD